MPTFIIIKAEAVHIVTLPFLSLARCRFPRQLSVISILRNGYGGNIAKVIVNLFSYEAILLCVDHGVTVGLEKMKAENNKVAFL